MKEADREYRKKRCLFQFVMLTNPDWKETPKKQREVKHMQRCLKIDLQKSFIFFVPLRNSKAPETYGVMQLLCTGFSESAWLQRQKDSTMELACSWARFPNAFGKRSD